MEPDTPHAPEQNAQAAYRKPPWLKSIKIRIIAFALAATIIPAIISMSEAMLSSGSYTLAARVMPRAAIAAASPVSKIGHARISRIDGIGETFFLAALDERLEALGYAWVEETGNPAAALFLSE